MRAAKYPVWRVLAQDRGIGELTRKVRSLADLVGVGDAASTPAREAELNSLLEAMRVPLPDVDVAEMLYLPGTVLTLVYGDGPQHAHMIASRAEDYERIIISRTMLADHLPWNYEIALQASSGRRAAMRTFDWF